MTILPSPILLDPLLHQWLLEDLGRGDCTTQGLFGQNIPEGNAEWIAKEVGKAYAPPVVTHP